MYECMHERTSAESSPCARAVEGEAVAPLARRHNHL